MNETKLAEIFQAAGPDADYTRTELEDVMSIVFLNSYRNVPMMSNAAETLIESFFARAGVNSQEDVDDLEGVLGRYFEAHPFRSDLLQEVLTAFEGSKGQPQALRAGYAISSAF